MRISSNQWQTSNHRSGRTAAQRTASRTQAKILGHITCKLLNTKNKEKHLDRIQRKDIPHLKESKVRTAAGLLSETRREE